MLPFFRDLGLALAGCALATLLAMPFRLALDLANIALLDTLIGDDRRHP